MNKKFFIAGGILAITALAACGSAAAGNSNNPRNSQGFRGNGAIGQVVDINNGTLVVSSPTGTDTTVTTSSSTKVNKTQTSSLSSMTSSDCAMVTGQKDSSGNVNAVNVTFFAQSSSGSCTRPGGGGFGNGNFTPNPNRPRPSFSPPAGVTRTPRYSGTVSNVSPASFTLTTTASGTLTVNVATTTKVNQIISEKVSDIQKGDCAAAIGKKQSNGDVAATTITITPMGPNGCSSGFSGRFGGGFSRGGAGGGGGFNGGGGNGGPPAGGDGGVGV